MNTKLDAVRVLRLFAFLSDNFSRILGIGAKRARWLPTPATKAPSLSLLLSFPPSPIQHLISSTYPPFCPSLVLHFDTRLQIR